MCFITEDKTEGRKTHKQVATEGSCSKVLTKHLKGGKSVFGDVYGLQRVIDCKGFSSIYYKKKTHIYNCTGLVNDKIKEKPE